MDTAERVAEVLNEMIDTDRDAFISFMSCRFRCNRVMAANKMLAKYFQYNEFSISVGTILDAIVSPDRIVPKFRLKCTSNPAEHDVFGGRDETPYRCRICGSRIEAGELLYYEAIKGSDVLQGSDGE